MKPHTPTSALGLTLLLSCTIWLAHQSGTRGLASPEAPFPTRPSAARPPVAAGPSQATSPLAAKLSPTSAPLALPHAGLRPGRASDDPATSRAIETLLARAALSYARAPRYYAKGTFHLVAKVNGSQRLARSETFELAYVRPSRLCITFRDPDSNSLTRQFSADGTRVLVVWDPCGLLCKPDPSRLLFRRFDQPPSLAAFVEEAFPGDLYPDPSGCLAASAIAPYLLSVDPLAAAHAHVVDYFYDGIEAVAGRPCHRIRFHQVDPPVAITHWIDNQDYSLRRMSLVHAQTEEGIPTYSLAAAAAGSMWLVTLDTISTTSLPRSIDFSPLPPPGTQETTAPRARSSSPPASSASFLERLLSRAIAAKTASTTVSVERQSPTDRWKIDRSWSFDAPIEGLSSGHTAFVILATKDRRLWWLDQAGLRALAPTTSFLADSPVAWKVRGQWCLVLARRGAPQLLATTTDGLTLWERTMPSEVLALYADDDPTSPSLFVGLEQGLFRLDPAGKTTFATSFARNLAEIAPAHHPDLGKVLVGLAIPHSELALFRTDGRPATKLLPEDPLRGIEPGPPASSLFLLGAISRDGQEVALRGIDPQGRTLFTTYLAPKMEQAAGDFTTVRSRTATSTAYTFVGVTPAGHLREIDERGRIVWDGDLIWHGWPRTSKTDPLVGAITSCDLDGDGQDELLLAARNRLIQLGRRGDEGPPAASPSSR